MRRKAQQLNNQGSTLLTVMICIALVAILGSMILSVTLVNLKMKIIESKAKENFYTCEVAMEEIRTGIEEITADIIQEVYDNKVFSNFAEFLFRFPTREEKNTYLKRQISAALVRQIGCADSYTDEELWSGCPVKERGDDIFQPYLSTPPAGASVSVTIGRDDSHLPIRTDGITVTIEEISVSMLRNDYLTSIKTDIVITLPDFSFDGAAHSEDPACTLEQPFKDYALVADGFIRSEQLGDESYVNGNVYAGAGIIVDGMHMQNHALNITAGQVVSRGTIKVEDTGKLNIRGPVAGSESKPALVWANNLMTATSLNSTVYEGFSPTALDIQGICFIKDDLTLDGSFSSVRLKGAYVGYSGAHTAQGSAIIVNGSGSSMDLSELESLVIAGRANISPDGAALEEDIMTGESISFKSNQRAYLIPGKFIDLIKRNPVTCADIDICGLPRIDFSLATSELAYTDYVEPTHTYKIAAKLTNPADADSLLRYYYLNLASGKKADEYLRQFKSLYPNVLNFMDPFRLGHVILPDASDPGKEVITVGNRIAFDGSTVTLEAGMSDGYETDVQLDTTLSNKILNHQIYTVQAGLPEIRLSMLPGLYSRISHLLSLNSSRIYQEADPTVGSLLNPAALATLAGETSVRYYDGDTVLGSAELAAGECSIIVVNGSVTLNANFRGILFAGKDITINRGITVDGLLIAMGSETDAADITLSDEVTVRGCLVAGGNISLGRKNNISSFMDTEIEDLYQSKAATIRKLLKNVNLTIRYQAGTVTDMRTIDLSSMISYVNWRKY
jgi:type II secretory pathway pseudopilin PulG